MPDAPKLSRFEPYEVVMTSGTLVIGVLGASLLPVVPPSAERVLPTWALYVFFVALFLSSLTVLTGIVKGTVGGLNLQRGGSIALGSLCGAFSAWTLSASGMAAYRSVILLLVIMIAAFWSAIRIHRALRPRRNTR
jgi:hypothetical protein